MLFSGIAIKRAAGVYFSIYLLLLLRGSLMVAIAYAAGAAAAFIAVGFIMKERNNSDANENRPQRIASSAHLPPFPIASKQIGKRNY
jgi:hypothetical protein